MTTTSEVLKQTLKKGDEPVEVTFDMLNVSSTSEIQSLIGKNLVSNVRYNGKDYNVSCVISDEKELLKVIQKSGIDLTIRSAIRAIIFPPANGGKLAKLSQVMAERQAAIFDMATNDLAFFNKTMSLTGPAREAMIDKWIAAAEIPDNEEVGNENPDQA